MPLVLLVDNTLTTYSILTLKRMGNLFKVKARDTSLGVTAVLLPSSQKHLGLPPRPCPLTCMVAFQDAGGGLLHACFQELRRRFILVTHAQPCKR
jgi:hypothetical protein